MVRGLSASAIRTVIDQVKADYSALDVEEKRLLEEQADIQARLATIPAQREELKLTMKYLEGLAVKVKSSEPTESEPVVPTNGKIHRQGLSVPTIKFLKALASGIDVETAMSSLPVKKESRANSLLVLQQLRDGILQPGQIAENARSVYSQICEAGMLDKAIGLLAREEAVVVIHEETGE